MMLSGDEMDKASNDQKAAWNAANPLPDMLTKIEQATTRNDESISGDLQP